MGNHSIWPHLQAGLPSHFPGAAATAPVGPVSDGQGHVPVCVGPAVLLLLRRISKSSKI